MLEYRNLKGDLLLNTNFGNGYSITQRNGKFVVIDILGNEFTFNKFENVTKFVHNALRFDDSREILYKELKSVD